MDHKIWSELTPESQAEIVDKLSGGDSPYTVAEAYGLHPESLARKWRHIRQSRNKNIKSQNIKQYASEDATTSILPQENILKTFSYDGFDGRILGAEESLPSEKFMFIDTDRPLTILFVTDTHFGQHDPVACDTFIRFAETVPHDLIVHGGDALECYGLSKYGKDPNMVFKNSLKSELREWRQFSTRLNNVSDAPKLIIAGNHIARYFTWLAANPAIMALEEYELDNLMKLEEFGYEPMVNSIYFDSQSSADFPNPKLLVHHGSISRRYSGNSARAESENRGYINSVSGHVHRLSASYRRTMSSQIMSAEGGTLRTLQPGWMEFPDWQHGCLQIQYDAKNSYVSAYPVLFLDGKAYFNGSKI